MTDSSKLIVCTTCAATNRVPDGRRLSQGKCAKCRAPLATTTPIAISDQIFSKLQARDEGVYVLDVWAPWCGPCKMMAPAYSASAKYFDGKLRFLKLNSEQYPTINKDLNIRGIPALFIFKNGKLVSQKSGAMPEQVMRTWVLGAAID